MTSSRRKEPPSRTAGATGPAAPKPETPDAVTPELPDAVRTDSGLEFLNAGSGNSLGDGSTTTGGAERGEANDTPPDEKAKK